MPLSTESEKCNDRGDDYQNSGGAPKHRSNGLLVLMKNKGDDASKKSEASDCRQIHNNHHHGKRSGCQHLHVDIN